MDRFVLKKNKKDGRIKYMKIVAVDICGTLYSCNTTFSYLNWKYKDNNKWKCFRRLMRCMIWKILNAISVKCLNIDITRRVAISFLKGERRSEIYSDVEHFYQEVLVYRQNEEIIKKVNAFNNLEEYDVVLVSATLDCIAEVVAGHLGIKKYYASELAYLENMCEGRIVTDYLSKKNMLFLGKHKPFVVITDDLSDKNIIDLSVEAIVVAYPSKLKKWMTLKTSCSHVIIIKHNNQMEFIANE